MEHKSKMYSKCFVEELEKHGIKANLKQNSNGNYEVWVSSEDGDKAEKIGDSMFGYSEMGQICRRNHNMGDSESFVFDVYSMDKNK